MKKEITLSDGEKVEAVAEFNDGYSHIILDDGCYVIVNGGKFSSHIFREAFEILKTLPSTPLLKDARHVVHVYDSGMITGDAEGSVSETEWEKLKDIVQKSDSPKEIIESVKEEQKVNPEFLGGKVPVYKGREEMYNKGDLNEK